MNLFPKPPSFSQLTEGLDTWPNWIKHEFQQRAINVKWFGAKGDGITDDLPAFQKALDSIPAGGGIIFVPKGDYLLSDSFTVDKSNVTLYLSPNARIRTATTTTGGHTIAFVGPAQNPTDISPQIENCTIMGGTVENTSPNTTENAIGFVRVKNAKCIDVNIPSCTRKAITAQYGVDNIYFIRNIIGFAGYRAITVETACKNIFILNNIINNAGSDGIQCTTATLQVENVIIKNNIIKTSEACGIYCGATNKLQILNNIIQNAGLNGIQVNQCEKVNIIRNDISDVYAHGIVTQNIATNLAVNFNQINNVNISQGGYSGLVFDSCTTTPRLFGNKLQGNNHFYAINTVNMSSYRIITVGNDLIAGTNGIYGNWQPKLAYDLVDGNLYRLDDNIRVMYGTSPPTTGTYNQGSIVFNTAPTAGGYIGWVCVAGGTPGTWKEFGTIAT